MTETQTRDVGDRPNLRAAIEAEADVLLTGDKDFLEAGVKNPAIMTPAVFLDTWLKQGQRAESGKLPARCIQSAADIGLGKLSTESIWAIAWKIKSVILQKNSIYKWKVMKSI